MYTPYVRLEEIVAEELKAHGTPDKMTVQDVLHALRERHRGGELWIGGEVLLRQRVAALVASERSRNEREAQGLWRS